MGTETQGFIVLAGLAGVYWLLLGRPHISKPGADGKRSKARHVRHAHAALALGAAALWFGHLRHLVVEGLEVLFGLAALLLLIRFAIRWRRRRGSRGDGTSGSSS